MIRLTPFLIAGYILMVGLPVRASIWQETGDAGDRFSPQTVVGIGPLEGVAGMIGGDDMVDAFEFYFDGSGVLSIIATFDESAPEIDGVAGDDQVLFLELFDPQGISVAGPKAVALSPELSVAGNYVIEVATTLAQDPPFSIGVTGPATGSVQFIPPAIPEPTSIAVWLLLLVGLVVCRRRR